MNDRALRDDRGRPRRPWQRLPARIGFDIVVASEVMAIFCLATDLHDLKERLGDIVVGYTRDQQPVHARDLDAHGAMTAAAARRAGAEPGADAREHAGIRARRPVRQHRARLQLVPRDQRRPAPRRLRRDRGRVRRRPRRGEVRRHPVPHDGPAPRRRRIVATVRAMKFHGGVDGRRPAERERRRARAAASSNLERHLATVRGTFGLPAVVAINHRAEDTDAEIAALVAAVERMGVVAVVLATHFAEGGEGAEQLARRGRPAVRRAVRARGSPIPTRRSAVGEDAQRSPRASTAPPRSPPARSARADPPPAGRGLRRTIRSAWPRPSTPSRPIPSCAARRPGTPSTSARCVWRRAPVRRHGLRRHHDDAGTARGACRGDDRRRRGRADRRAVLRRRHDWKT